MQWDIANWDDEDYANRFILGGEWVRRPGRTRRTLMLRLIARYLVQPFNVRGWLSPIDTFHLIQADFLFIDMIGGVQEFLTWQVHINLLRQISLISPERYDQDLQDQVQQMAFQYFREQAAEDLMRID